MNAVSPLADSSSSSPLILVIEGDDGDYEAIYHSLRHSPTETRLHRCTTGKQALKYLERSFQQILIHPNLIPRLILLALNLPGIDDWSVLEVIKQDPVFKCIPIVMLIFPDDLGTVEECYRLGANSCLIKIIDFYQFRKTILTTVKFWLEIAVIPNFSRAAKSKPDGSNY